MLLGDVEWHDVGVGCVIFLDSMHNRRVGCWFVVVLNWLCCFVWQKVQLEFVALVQYIKDAVISLGGILDNIMGGHLNYSMVCESHP